VGEDFVSVFWTQSWVEDEIVKGRLEAEGIPVDLKGVAKARYPTGPMELFVPSDFEVQARRILNEINSGSYEVPDGPEDDAGRVQKREQPESRMRAGTGARIRAYLSPSACD
jgi:Putative prokaryotic signal transducing protein